VEAVVATYTQDTRRIVIDTPLGDDVLLLSAFVGHEEMSRLFNFELELLSPKDNISPNSIVGKNVTFSVKYADDTWRHFNGHVNRFAYCGRGDRLSIFRATVVPWFWFLTKTSDLRIFQNKTVPDIIKQIFSDLGFTQFKIDAKGSHPKWDYCVQYRETDFNFVSRLMEQEGMFYFFQHDKGKHTLVISDHKGAYLDGRDADAVEMRGHLSEPEIFDHIYTWEHHHEFRSGKWAHTDYNFETPSTSLMADAKSVVNMDGNGKLEFYDFPGEYEKKSEGDDEVKWRMEEEEAPHERVQGESHCRSFSPGVKFKVKNHFHKEEEGKTFVITAVRHVGRAGNTYVTTTDSTTDSYRNNFTCIPDSVSYRPPRLTPKPMIHGSQTAVVVGPKGEEIYTDKYGRIKVQFHWDREGKKDEKSSCWIRCSQISAGKNWGVMSIPRIGQEVVVSYLEGDPDRPLVTGVVYNAEQMPAYELPKEMTKSWIKTNSSKGGDGFNEIRFEDKKDKEQIFIHAERNMDTRVKSDCMERVAGNRHLIVGNENGGDQRELVHGDKHLHVKGNQIELIEIDNRLTVGGQQDIVVKGNRKQLVKGNEYVHIEGAKFENIESFHSMDVGMHSVKSGTHHLFDARYAINFKAGTHVIIEAGTELSLVGPGGFIHIGAGGVTIDGTMVWINSGGPGPNSFNGLEPGEPLDASEADPTQPTEADNSKTGYRSCPD